MIKTLVVNADGLIVASLPAAESRAKEPGTPTGVEISPSAGQQVRKVEIPDALAHLSLHELQPRFRLDLDTGDLLELKPSPSVRDEQTGA